MEVGRADAQQGVVAQDARSQELTGIAGGLALVGTGALPVGIGLLADKRRMKRAR